MTNKTYVICRGLTIEELEEEVNKLMPLGYIPAGGVAHYYHCYDSHNGIDEEVFHQAMYLIEKKVGFKCQEEMQK